MERRQPVHKGGLLCAFTFFLAISAAAPVPALAERLAVKTYSMADGLPRNSVNCIRRDSRGFLWFCTDDGLSRFDGHAFTNYGTEQGLPDAHVSDFLEARNGEYWVATAAGLCRFNPQPSQSSGKAPARKTAGSRSPIFEVFRPGTGDMEGRISAIEEDRDGSIWCGTFGGLYRFTPGAARHFAYMETGSSNPLVEKLLLDHEGTLWVVLDGLLVRRRPDGRVERYAEREGLPGGQPYHLKVNELLEDRTRHIWIATWEGLCRLVVDPKPGRPAVDRIYTTREGLPDNHIESVFESSDGVLWVTARGHLAGFVSEGVDSHQKFRSYFNAGGPLGEDPGGNLWINTSRWARNGFTGYTVEDGLASATIFSIFEDQQGRLCLVTGDKLDLGGFISRLEGRRFVSIEPKVPAGTFFTWGVGNTHFQDHAGAWWIATGQGLCRYPKLARMEDLAHMLPEVLFTTHDGLPSNEIYQLFEDSRGDVWISVIGPNLVTRWSRADGSFHNYERDDEGKPLGTPISFAEDRAGNLWMGFFWHDVARYRNGRFQVLTEPDGLPAGVVHGIYADHAGRVWLATSRGGLARIDDPTADRIQFKSYTTAEGLSSNETWCITEDAWGRIYIGTGRGVDRLDPQTGRIQNYPAAAGLGFQTQPRVAYRDRQGVLWFGSVDALTRLIPEPSRVLSPPRIRITQIRLRGTPYPVSELGEIALNGPTLEPDQNHVEFGFGSLNFSAREVIRYQYKLEGSDHDWSPLTDLRMVNYSSLSPASYRFLVRAVNSEGVPSPNPAWVKFVILRPIWQRWWFLGLAVIVSAAVVYAMFRYRLERLLEIERVRTRIAADLHDDIGSSLTQIAIMSEVALQKASAACENPSCPIHPGLRVSEPLARVAELSRGLVDSMSDVVWAINPRRDHLSDLSHRMRRFASDVLAARNIDFGFSAPSRLGDASLRADVRREVFLVFKESLNNIARHSGCQRVEITLEIEESRLLMRVNDDGRGFELSASGNGGQASGHGLKSMDRRARNVGGSLQVISSPESGTHVTMEVPLDRTPLLGRRKSLPE